MTTRERIDALIPILRSAIGEKIFSTPTEVLTLTPELCPEWTPNVQYFANIVVSYNGIKYYIQQAVLSQAHLTPNSIGLEAIYKPYRTAKPQDWLYNEYVEEGWIRYDNGVAYELYNAPFGSIFQNLWRPSQLPSNWKTVNQE